MGKFGDGTLDVEAGGVVSNAKGIIAENPGSTGTVVVNGTGSRWNNSEDLRVGNSGNGTLRVEAGGYVSNQGARIGETVDSSGAVTVTGAGSRWISSRAIAYVGFLGDGTLDVEAGGVVSSGAGTIGMFSTAVATVTGTGSQWNSSDWLVVAFEGDGTLDVEAGGAVSTATGIIAERLGSTGVVTVAGAGSQWNSGALYLGGTSEAAGGAGTLNIADSGAGSVAGTTKLWSGGTLTLNGGSLTTGSFHNTVGGVFNFNDGALTVNRSGGSFNPRTGEPFIINGITALAMPTLEIANTATANLGSEDIVVGDSKQGELKILTGGVFSNDEGIIAKDLGSTGTVLVNGTGSRWNNSGDLVVAYSGSGTLNVEAGGVVSNALAIIGQNPGSTGGVTVTGAGSQWNSSSSPDLISLAVGYEGNGTLDVEAGGVVSTTTSCIGFGPVSTGGVTVTGAGSQLNSLGPMAVGYVGNGTLDVEAGGVVSGSVGFLGFEPGSTGVATVTGAGSQWLNLAHMIVGGFGNGTLNVQAGGVVGNVDAIIGQTPESTGVATVTGAGSQWGSWHLYVNGTLNVEAGGVVSDWLGAIGTNAGMNGAVTVTGAGSQWNHMSDLYIAEVPDDAGAGAPGAGTLNIADSGLVTVGGRTTVGTNGGVTLNGGRFEFGVTDAASYARFSGTSGTLTGSVELFGYNSIQVLSDYSISNLDTSEVWHGNHGVIHGSGVSTHGLANRSDGEVRTFSGEWARFGGTSNINAGEINNFGGAVEFEGSVTNLSGGLIGVRGQFIAQGGWTNEGVMAFSGTADILGDISNEAGGQIVTSGGATTTILDDLVHNGAEIRTSAGSSIVIFGAASGAGPYTGTGTVFFEGDLRPGNSPGVVSFGGDVQFGSSLNSEFELGGIILGEFDRLNVTGELTPGGVLQVTLIDEFAPNVGDTFDILDWGMLTAAATFDTVNLPTLTGRKAWDQSKLYTDGVISVVGMLDGDTDLDWDVDDADYYTFIGAFGGDGDWHTDFNEDGRVDLADFVLMRANFGTVATPSPMPLKPAATPEPTTVTLLTVGGLLAISRRRRRAGRSAA